MVLKLDMSKANDRVERPFIELMMRAMGFVDSWAGGIFKLERRLRQVDPLSPLYVLVLWRRAFDANETCKSGRTDKGCEDHRLCLVDVQGLLTLVLVYLETFLRLWALSRTIPYCNSLACIR
ncbi:hypothetical protein PVK06_021175 [Gossypium arboreum]|uniref:Reverse transcriptase n=1 Tax=Gossypium arboreum TaxID=29729 RepID=A0ABR0PPI7_GOSAR|nr:hypothetical protein PVK06_021175 [Gossypium arboreum]